MLGWLTHLHRPCVELGKSDMFRFLDPYYTTLSQNDHVSVQTYIQNTMDHNKKDLYLAPYFNNHHWKLLIINPKKREVAFLCSLGKKPTDKKISAIVDSYCRALEGYNRLQRVRKHNKVSKNVQESCANLILELIEANAESS